MNTIIGIVLSGYAITASAGVEAQYAELITKQLNPCKTVTARYMSNGTYHAGDTEDLSLVFTHEEAIARAKAFVQNKNYKPRLFKEDGVCELYLEYKE